MSLCYCYSSYLITSKPQSQAFTGEISHNMHRYIKVTEKENKAQGV